MTAATLSPNDSTTLSLIFDPESSPCAQTAVISGGLPPDRHYDAATVQRLRTRELEAVSCAEDSPATALAILSRLIASHPQYASAYNNRAQLRRLLSHPAADVVADLRCAIELAGPPRATDPVSPLQAKVLANAYTQLATVFLADGREDAAGETFQIAARYGGEVAKVMAVKLNPVARLCGAIVKEAMREEMGG